MQTGGEIHCSPTVEPHWKETMKEGLRRIVESVCKALDNGAYVSVEQRHAVEDAGVDKNGDIQYRYGRNASVKIWHLFT